ncbi:hypothetical protein ASG31_14430 [Chryseobacterium sp. Leaf404]|uniref:hypothetical protein n=1 Tax=unclassified Chryseobacterium TaxID=2593645 RepID=UPI0006FE986E|nr:MULTISPECIES: hypothetical protein [unclassified Chryseobacterium]KQT15461.1 hypothetical protein ASG31_14430 [Chryseobacterium sp. Leaf404]
MKVKNVILILLILISCNEKNYGNNHFEDLDIYNEKQINNFLQFFLKNLDDKDDFSLMLSNTKFCGNRLDKDSVLHQPEKWLVTKSQSDSLFTGEDMVSIKEQLNDKRNYVILKENVEQKILNSDSLRAENIKFGNWQSTKIDSLRKISTSKALEYIRRERPVEYYNYKKKFTPIIYFDKPIFLKDKNKVIFSYYYYH